MIVVEVELCALVALTEGEVVVSLVSQRSVDERKAICGRAEGVL